MFSSILSLPCPVPVSSFLPCLCHVSPPSSVENVKEVLKLVLDNKGAVVATGELTVFLDGLTVNQEQLLNGNAATSTSEYRCVSGCLF